MAETHSLQDMRQQTAITAKVFIQRDYSSGTMCQFQTKFPSELENRIDKQQFEETVRALNNMYAEAEKLGSQSYIEGCLACLTAYTVFLCMETHYEKGAWIAGPFYLELNCSEGSSVMGLSEVGFEENCKVHSGTE
uniref:Golgin subfamily A member 7 n=1 Tax=Oreochromis aureus TaxID=47969 RepID=A0A668SQC7_OREAU